VILEEFDATRDTLATIFGGSLEARRPRMLKTLALRDAALRTLHIHQIDLLKRWRVLRAEKVLDAERLLPEVLLSINAIASGLRTTG
jgi:phosphoenolpyruvate carboxylase